ncbi:Second ORF in transposon ISC1212 [Saccharolobus solfataricus P2]|uniref:Second ORF in transposon ISC1212 n=1 Tax=Saccharolobus solfataricus (strain ATCC 35092 / DSM 1617 / JCM 11322 / P2) TaxID=273057 RepID=Q97UI6_SACS2|nr:hypothetical protein [Saccharolobus solfataricus]AAK43132.1 Second ORF in transposon ISC1212 [Saccharolobus solfataricus P2]
MGFNDVFLLMGYTTSRLKNFTAFRKYKGSWGRKHGKSYFGFKVLWKGGLISLGTSRLDC